MAFPLGIFGLIASSYFYYRRNHKQWLLLYEEWERIASAMRLTEMDHEVIGNYRNHNVIIAEIASGREGLIKTRYSVDFENTRMILLYIKKSFALPRGYESSLRKKYVKDIKMDDPQFLEGLVIKGNNENAANSILNLSIRNKIKNIQDTFYELEIGYGKFHSYPWPPNKIDIEPNIIRYVDSRSLEETEANAVKFKWILDALIDMVEKVEKYNSQI
ncbi:MAG: hypothetical protein QG670_2086, partial [Thermoproteota archaeon]|nr:hypothetical protein [Thermoproteota archaeon]